MPFDGTQLDETTKLLIAARERIERGWCQGAGRSREGVCAIVAMSDVAPSHEAYGAACLLMTGIVGCGVSDWNDRPERTKEDVLAAFDRAIAGKRIPMTNECGARNGRDRKGGLRPLQSGNAPRTPILLETA